MYNAFDRLSRIISKKDKIIFATMEDAEYNNYSAVSKSATQRKDITHSKRGHCPLISGYEVSA